jgi:hypothetical protein
MREAMRGAVRAYMPGTMAEISAGTGLTYGVVRHRVREMRLAGLAHVGRWADGNTPVFYYGPGEAAARPKAKSNTEYSQQWEARNRKTEAGDLRRAKARARYHLDQHKAKAKARPCGPFAALGL